MRIAVNGYFYSQPFCGQGVYLQNVLRVLSLLKDGNEYLLFRPLVSGRLRRWYKLLWENFEFPLRCFLARADLAFIPYFGPPLFSPVPFVLTIHDLVPYLFAQYRLPVIGNLYNLLRRFGASRALWVIADSISTRDDILNLLRLPEKKVKVVYLGVEPEFRKIDTPFKLDEARLRLNLPEKFILYVGGMDYRKNLKRLVKAVGLLSKDDSALSLVIVGQPKVQHLKYLDYPYIKIINKADRKDLPAIYNLAKVFVYPSLYEGFGLPPLEALACGIPVVVSRNSSLGEIFNEAGYYIEDERNVESIALALDKALHPDPSEFRTKQEKGFELAKRYNWEETARCLAEVFNYENCCCSR
ncbi:MAG: glycosyltransferase family 1 protein [Patescibacteria group bacterium]